jgi:hypothetical protein
MNGSIIPTLDRLLVLGWVCITTAVLFFRKTYNDFLDIQGGCCIIFNGWGNCSAGTRYMDAKPIRIGVREGAGPPPGYRWSVWLLRWAVDEANSFLTPVQRKYLAMQFKELALQDDPTHSVSISVRSMSPESYYELRDKGGVLGRINVRVFFGVDKDNRAIVVLGSINKKGDGPTPRGDVIRIRRRWQMYLNHKYEKPISG